MKETLELKPHDPSTVPTAFLTAASYNNYFLFSTTTFLDHVTSWGAFGKVSTTNRISDPFGIYQPK
jgi:selenophosphate synthase